jgi:hypothetical protein
LTRLLVVSIAAVALLAGTVFVASAQTPKSESWGCPGWASGTDGGYSYSASPMYGILADTLGLTAEGLAAELQAGKSVADVAAEKGVSLDELVEALEAPMDEMMQAMTGYGHMSQEQIDSMKEWRASMHRQALEVKGGWTGMMDGGMMGTLGGMMGTFGGMMGGFGSMMGGIGGMMGGQGASGGMMGGQGASGGMMGGQGGMMGGFGR